MTSKKLKNIILTRDRKLSPRIGLMYSLMTNIRTSLYDFLHKIDNEALDFTPSDRKIESIGTLCHYKKNQKETPELI
ncbi:MAG: hypothetical protein ACXAB2_03855 [Candidatus Hodarchaeales archaeon]